jgi:hypothetical protein
MRLIVMRRQALNARRSGFGREAFALMFDIRAKARASRLKPLLRPVLRRCALLERIALRRGVVRDLSE